MKAMKTAEEILENITCCTIDEDADLDAKENYYYQHDDVVKVIEQAQKDAYNKALEDAALFAKTEYVTVKMGTGFKGVHRVDTYSILKFKK